jgi:hypothetical protein
MIVYGEFLRSWTRSNNVQFNDASLKFALKKPTYFMGEKYDLVSKHFLFFYNDAHNYKITGILKQLKFRRSLRHVSVHAGTIIREPFFLVLS